jgi:hypothetical protein
VLLLGWRIDFESLSNVFNYYSLTAGQVIHGSKSVTAKAEHIFQAVSNVSIKICHTLVFEGQQTKEIFKKRIILQFNEK